LTFASRREASCLTSHILSNVSPGVPEEKLFKAVFNRAYGHLHKVRDIMSDKSKLAAFSVSRKMRLITDALKQCLGWVLVQQEEGGYVWAGSAVLTPAQRKYPALNLELLGVVHAVKSCDYYLQGMSKVKAVTDHNPLIGLYKKYL
jgi:hypothetical protein